jgi:hypothetical protein
MSPLVAGVGAQQIVAWHTQCDAGGIAARVAAARDRASSREPARPRAARR